MKRGGPLRRKTPLPRGDKSLKRVAFRRRPVEPDAYEREFQRQRHLVRIRSGGRCEIRAKHCRGESSHVHHRQRRSQGGDNSLENLLDLCSVCHFRVHRFPEQAFEHGWLVHEWDDPARVPVLTP